MDDAEHLHVERRRTLGRVGHLHDREWLVVAVDQQERLVPLAAEVACTIGLDVERPSGDVDDLGRVERGPRRGEHGVHGQRMVAARMGAPRSPATT